jgi:hypothetical protein
MRQAVQLGVHNRHQRIERALVAVAPGEQESGDVGLIG